MKFRFLLLCLASSAVWAETVPDRGELQLDSVRGARFQFTGPVGDRIVANRDNWLLIAPQANPGMLEMFRVRDRKPTPELVPWAGEFVGKYLISGIQAMRMTEDPRLALQMSNVVSAFIATQAPDGYLGPFPKEIQLLKNWDLWGHYHALVALAMWYEQTGDPAALAAARKAADLVCQTYLHTNRRVIQAGDPEMNMTILTGMALLYRLTAEPRYLEMVREVEKDWEQAGDYLRSGLDGREYFQTPRPRWESLHDLQGLMELWRITGDPRYRDAFIHHWRSIRRWDQHNTGAFSSGEQATGNPFSPAAIETCCTVAWMTLTADYLRLTGDVRAGDDLELATLNGGIGAQHPSGRWWTYNTPMDGVREASAHTIVFQSRAGTPELNCCSVNAPRVLGLLSEWGVMAGPGGVLINSYLPATVTIPRPEGELRLTLLQDYPRTNRQTLRIDAAPPGESTLRFRIPGWSTHTRVRSANLGVSANPAAGSVWEIHRAWKPGDSISLDFDFGLRAVCGAQEAAGRVSIYRGPLLLVYDQARNAFDEAAIPAVNLTRLNEARVISATVAADLRVQPNFVELEIPTDAAPLRLVDFASAGASGTRYRSWLPAQNPPPPPAFTQYPRDGAEIQPGRVGFQWRGPRPGRESRYRLEVSTNREFSGRIKSADVTAATRVTLELAPLAGEKSSDRWWRVANVGTYGESLPDVPAARFRLVNTAPPSVLPPELKPGPNAELVLHDLRKDEHPSFGNLQPPVIPGRTTAGLKLNGTDQKLVYELGTWPEEDYTVLVCVRIDQIPKERLGQVFSAWSVSMDDPLRLVIDNGKLFARIENGGGFSTGGAPISSGQLHWIAAAKRGSNLTLLLDGKNVGSTAAPAFLNTNARDCALGGNPHFGGNECLAATFAYFGFWNRAPTAEELQKLATP